MENAFNERGVSVTRNNLSCAGLVFPLHEIRDLAVVAVNKNAIVPILISLIGVAAIAAGALYAVSGGIVVGAMLAVVGYLTWITQDVTYRLVVDTAEGKREAVVSVESEFIEQVAQMVRDAKAAQPAATTAAAKN
ncbi:MAG: DUF6232 family protein [Burkholderia sp.]